MSFKMFFFQNCEKDFFLIIFEIFLSLVFLIPFNYSLDAKNHYKLLQKTYLLYFACQIYETLIYLALVKFSLNFNFATI